MLDTRDSTPTPDRKAIQALYQTRGIVPATRGFGCKFLDSCVESRCPAGMQFHTGNWAYVGIEYGQASVCSVSVRILFVAMDRGGYGGADVERFEDAQAAFRNSMEHPNNAHMGGAAAIMKHLVDERDPVKRGGQIALTNAVKCVVHTGSMETDPSRTMIDRCAKHLLEEVRVLRPDVIITQGVHPSDTVTSLLPSLKPIASYRGELRGKAEVLLGSETLVLTTPHPARLKGLRWKRAELPPFLQRALRKTREELVPWMRSKQGALVTESHEAKRRGPHVRKTDQ